MLSVDTSERVWKWHITMSSRRLAMHRRIERTFASDDFEEGHDLLA